MVDIEFIEQLIESMEESVQRLEKAIRENNSNEANKLRTFIFDLYRQVNLATEVKNV